jgi:hypothetical protein
MQLMAPTMREEVALSRLASGDRLDPVANVHAGIRYFARLVNAFEDLELALMAYNAGPARVRVHLRAGVVPERLRAYPRAVLGHLARLSARPHEPVAVETSSVRASVPVWRGSGAAAALCVSGPLSLPLRPIVLDRHADAAC